MKTFIFAVVLALSCATSWAQWTDGSGKPLADTEWRKTADGLGAMLLVAGDYNAFIKEWTGSGEGHAPSLNPVKELKRGGEATILIFFSGCAKAGARCDLSADFKVIAPDGSTYGEFKDRIAFAAKIDKEGTVILSHAMTQLNIEPQDALGEYKVLATLRRPSTGTSIELRQALRVVP
ncbi:MAG: hypothetical protein WA190_09835 [Usitatibacter sp.]